jgi:ubiquinone/menaquinone biosynthesis C-methylase UbiE
VVSEFIDVTELAGTEISAEQLDRMVHRYQWAVQFCEDKDVLEVACGSGQGLGALRSVARSLEAGDFSAQILQLARAHYGELLPLRQFDAQAIPCADASKDVIILFEAIYYVPDAQKFAQECRRILRPGGSVLIATANKDLSDFNPSPLSHRYYGAADFAQLFAGDAFDVEVFGYLPIGSVSWRQRVLRPLKKSAVGLGLMPKSMKGKKLFKRLVFGKLVPMPSELHLNETVPESPLPLAVGAPDRLHKVLYCKATLRL